LISAACESACRRMAIFLSAVPPVSVFRATSQLCPAKTAKGLSRCPRPREAGDKARTGGVPAGEDDRERRGGLAASAASRAESPLVSKAFLNREVPPSIQPSDRIPSRNSISRKIAKFR